MSSRTKKIIGVVIAIIILLLLLFLWLTSQSQPIETPVVVDTEEQPPTPIGSLTPTPDADKPPVYSATEPAMPEPEPEAEADPRSNLVSVAAAFAERYGSFSNQGDYENLEELQALMTDSLAEQTQDFIVEARAAGPGTAAYVGMTSRSISTAVTGFNQESGRATVTVTTQRQETTSQGTRVYYQDLELQFILVEDVWKVNSAIWAEETS